MSSSQPAHGNVAALPATEQEAGYRPLFFRFSEMDQREHWAHFQHNHQGRIDVYDTFRQQLFGLIKSRNPKSDLTRQELDEAVARYCEGRAQDELGVWVYYPWRQALVHLLDEADFVELRTSRNRYKIAPAEQQALLNRRIGVVGLSVGAHIALTMATERICGELRLADFDQLELSNLNRLRESVCHLGLPKTTLAARSVAEIDPFLRVVCYGQGLEPTNIDDFLLTDGRLDLLVEECDSLNIKLLCRHRARQLRIPMLMEATDRGTLDIERFDLEPERPILHGLLEGMDTSRLGELTTSDQKVPYIMRMVGETTMSNRLRASLLEVGESIETWPQLASDVALGAALVTNVARRVLLEQLHDSGRYFVDLSELIQDTELASGISFAAPNRPVTSPSSLPELLPELSAGWEPAQLALGSTMLDALIEAGVSAPSGGNEQPWRWVMRDRNLWLVPEPRSAGGLLDFRGIATQIALGAAAENVVLRAHELGLTVRLDAPSDADTSATCFRFFPAGTQIAGAETHEYDTLASAIGERHTNRRRTHSLRLPAGVLEELRMAARSIAGIDLTFIEDRPALAEIANIAARAERIRILHPTGHHDLVHEIRWSPEEAQRTRDGIDLATLDLTPTELAGLRMLREPGVPELLKRWQRGRGLESLTRKAMIASSAVGLVTASGADARDPFMVGRAVQRLWLLATERALALQPHTASIFLFARALHGGAADFDSESLGELYGLHARLRAIFGHRAREFFLFRLFPGCEPLARSLRRSVSVHHADSRR